MEDATSVVEKEYSSEEGRLWLGWITVEDEEDGGALVFQVSF